MVPSSPISALPRAGPDTMLDARCAQQVAVHIGVNGRHVKADRHRAMGHRHIRQSDRRVAVCVPERGQKVRDRHLP